MSTQREALEKTVPTTEVIRDAVTFPRNRLGEPMDISAERFDKWLESVKAEVWDEGYQRAHRDAPRFEGDEWADTTNPYPYPYRT